MLLMAWARGAPGRRSFEWGQVPYWLYSLWFLCRFPADPCRADIVKKMSKLL